MSSTVEAKATFQALVAEHQRLLLKVAYGVLLDWHEAQDAVQDTLVSCYHRLERLDLSDPKAIRAYLLRSTRNSAIDIARRRARTVDDSVALWEETTSDSHRAILLSCLSRLTPLNRLIMVLRSIEELSPEEVVALLDGFDLDPLERRPKMEAMLNYTRRYGVNTVGAIGNRIKTSRKFLKECFEEGLNDE